MVLGGILAGAGVSKDKTMNTNLLGTLLSQIVSLLNFASSREINIFALRFGLIDGAPKALDDIAQIYGESRERIRQIESKFLSKIRYYLKESPCPSCGETITASSHEEILKRIPAAVELTELISQCNNYSEYIENLVFEDLDLHMSPEVLRYLFRVISQEELAQKLFITKVEFRNTANLCNQIRALAK